MIAVAAACYTPVGLTFDEPTHRYMHNGIDLISVTTALRSAALVDLAYATEDARALGTQVHAAIELFHGGDLYATVPEIAPFLAAYRRFLGQSLFAVHAVEERLADPALGVAGTLDLRGRFMGNAAALDQPDVIDVIDIKTGTPPDWVGYQTAGYVRLLPADVRRRCRRWCLNLRGDGGYTLKPLIKRSDETVFIAALTVARAKRGEL